MTTFELIRSDTGDGGWSLHHKDMEDEDGVPTCVLVSGPSDLDATMDEWSRPDDDDYSAAEREYAKWRDDTNERITTIVSSGDGVKLPTSVAGQKIVVVNSGATPMQVFGVETETINRNRKS